jgi:phage baseplate assembly protein W
MTGFDDPRGRHSEELAVLAEQAERDGRLDEARDKFAAAAALEEAVVAAVTLNEPRVKAVLATSAVALWFKARRLDRAMALARHYLATGVSRGSELAELLELIRDAWLHDGLPTTLASHSEAARQYWEAREQLEAEILGSSNRPARVTWVDQLWRALADTDVRTIAQELIASDAIDRTGEFLCVDVELENVDAVGPRAASR